MGTLWRVVRDWWHAGAPLRPHVAAAHCDRAVIRAAKLVRGIAYEVGRIEAARSTPHPKRKRKRQVVS